MRDQFRVELPKVVIFPKAAPTESPSIGLGVDIHLKRVRVFAGDGRQALVLQHARAVLLVAAPSD